MSIGVIFTSGIVLYGILSILSPKILDKFNLVYKDQEGKHGKR